MSERLRVWLRYDPERVPAVEAAYAEYLRCSKPGVAFAVALAVAFSSAVGVGVWAALHGSTQASMVAPLLVTFSIAFYGVLLFAVVRSPLPVLGRVLAGAVSVPRACVLAIALGFACVVVELAAIALLVSAGHGRTGRGQTVDYFGGGVILGAVLLTMAAPVLEEFLMQGWLQTRLARLGPFWAAALTTLVFVLIHVPTSILDLARGVGLATAAWFRATTRSLLACVIVHATNNGLIALLLLAARTNPVHK